MPGGAARNREFVAAHTDWGQATEAEQGLVVDPQTSGGLLVALPGAAADDYLARVPGSVEVGRVESRGDRLLRLD